MHHSHFVYSSVCTIDLEKFTQYLTLNTVFTNKRLSLLSRCNVYTRETYKQSGSVKRKVV